MSLKAFHIVFITAATALAFGFGFWCIRQFRDGTGSTGTLVMGLASLAAGVALGVYGWFFLRKTKQIYLV